MFDPEVRQLSVIESYEPQHTTLTCSYILNMRGKRLGSFLTDRSPSFTIEQCGPIQWYFKLIERLDTSTLSLHCSSPIPAVKMTKCTRERQWSRCGRLVTHLNEELCQDFEAVASIELPEMPLQPPTARRPYVIRGGPSDRNRRRLLDTLRTRMSNNSMRNSTSCEFEIIIPFEIDNAPAPPAEINNAIYGPTLLQDMRSALENEIHTDVILQTANKTLKAHKVILSARSSVFAAMFQSDMKERAENIVKITDIDGQVLEELRHFMYTDEIPKLNSMALNLLIAADKYNVKLLKARCEEHLFKNITVDTAAESLIVADSHNFGDLKKELMLFINLHKKEFMKTDKYQELRASHAHLIVDLFEAGD